MFNNHRVTSSNETGFECVHDTSGIRAVINHAREEVASNPSLMGKAFGATRGYVLRFKGDQLTMEPCWFAMGVIDEAGFNKNPKVFLNPLIPDLAYELRYKKGSFVYTTISDELCDFVTSEKYNIGGETALFWSADALDLNLERPIDPQIKDPQVTSTLYRAVLHPILKGPSNEMLLGDSNNISLELANKVEGYIDDYHNYVRKHAGAIKWIESQENPASVIITGSQKASVPVLWYQDINHYEFFLDIATNWRTSRQGKWVSGSGGLFIIRHHKLDDGFLTNISFSLNA